MASFGLFASSDDTDAKEHTRAAVVVGSVAVTGSISLDSDEVSSAKLLVSYLFEPTSQAYDTLQVRMPLGAHAERPTEPVRAFVLGVESSLEFVRLDEHEHDVVYVLKAVPENAKVSINAEYQLRSPLSDSTPSVQLPLPAEPLALTLNLSFSPAHYRVAAQSLSLLTAATAANPVVHIVHEQATNSNNNGDVRLSFEGPVNSAKLLLTFTSSGSGRSSITSSRESVDDDESESDSQDDDESEGDSQDDSPASSRQNGGEDRPKLQYTLDTLRRLQFGPVRYPIEQHARPERERERERERDCGWRWRSPFVACSL